MSVEYNNIYLLNNKNRVMPFMYHRREIVAPKCRFEDLDMVIIGILPEIRSESYGHENVRRYIILPNGNPSLFPSDRGRIDEKDSRKYFALACIEQGLSFGEIGFWLDFCIKNFGGIHADGKKRRIVAEKTSSLRFDRRKHIYSYSGIWRKSIMIDERIC